MKLDELFPKKYLSADDLGGKPRTLRIRSIELRKMRNPTDECDAKGKRIYEMAQKPVVFFDKKFAGIVLNKTRVAELAQALGISDTDAARGLLIVAYPDGNHIHFRRAPAQPTPTPPAADPDTGEIHDAPAE